MAYRVTQRIISSDDLLYPYFDNMQIDHLREWFLNPFFS